MIASLLGLSAQCGTVILVTLVRRAVSLYPTQKLKNPVRQLFARVVDGGAASSASLTAEDKVLRYHILKLMTRFETSWKNPALRVPFMDTLPERLGELVNDGLLELGPDGARIPEAGHAFVRNICMAFDARLVRKAPTTALFSKAI